MKLKVQLIILFLLALSNIANSQSELITQLNKVIIPIQTISPDSNLTDIKQLIPLLKDKEIIGLGEATHGTHEFFVYKHRLVKLLTTKADFKIFVIEADFAGSQTMNNYILHGEGDPLNALYNMGVGVWMTNEFVAMVEWMRQYNSTQKPENKIRFYGSDMQNPQIAAKKIKDYLLNEQKLNTTIETGLELFINRNQIKKYSKSDKKLIALSLSEIDKIFKSVLETDNKEHKFLNHCKRELEQNLELISKGGGFSRTILRNKFMAENVNWVYNFENQEKTMFWAHNEHIALSSNQSKIIPSGYHLKEQFGDDYYAFGFSFYGGEIRAYNSELRKYEICSIIEVSVEKSADKIFNQCNKSNFILDFNSASENDEINEFLDTKLYSRAIGAKYYPVDNVNRNYSFRKLIESFDGLIFFNETSSSRPTVVAMNQGEE